MRDRRTLTDELSWTKARRWHRRDCAVADGGLWIIALLLTSAALFATDEPTDAEHLLYLADNGLAVIQLQIEIDGKSQRELCRTCLQAICGGADRDQDGFLTAEEYDSRVATHPILQERQAAMPPRMNAAPALPDFGAEGRLPIDTVTTYLLHHAGSPLALDFTANRMRRISETGELLSRPLADTQLFECLDTDGNHKLTPRELERAATVLSKFDFDEDEMISLDELRQQPTTNSAMPPNRPARKSDAHLSLLSAERIDAQFVRRVLTHYDGVAQGSTKDLRLDRSELGVAPELFASADADKDGFCDFDELWRFLERPHASIEITVRLTTGGVTEADIAMVDESAAKLLDQRPGMIRLDIHGTRLDLLLPPSASLNHGSDSALTMQFRSLDDDKNEYLEAKEFPFGTEGDDVSPIFRSMDANGDEKVYLDEYLAYFQRDQFTRASFLVLNVENLGRTLFGPLDVNGDGRLTLRELAGLKDRLAEWDADGDGKLTEAEIPLQYRLRLSHDERRLAGLSGPFFTGNDNSNANPTSAAPLWFRKMDRNRDGEVSLREFLGTKKQFGKIDANGDGAIDAAEAATVK